MSRTLHVLPQGRLGIAENWAVSCVEEPPWFIISTAV
jgi:hypothetical protein